MGPLADRNGTEVKCAFLFASESNRARGCKIVITDDELTVYHETNELIPRSEEGRYIAIEKVVPLAAIFSVDARIWGDRNLRNYDPISGSPDQHAHIDLDLSLYVDKNERVGVDSEDHAHIIIGFREEQYSAANDLANDGDTLAYPSPSDFLGIQTSDEFGTALTEWLVDSLAMTRSVIPERLMDDTLAFQDTSGASPDQLVQRLLETNACVGCDLQGVDLADADLDRANLAGANLQGVNFQGADLDFAYFVGANLQGANLAESELDGAMLMMANLESANLQDAQLVGANFQGANLTNANLQRHESIAADFQDALLVGANLSQADMLGINLNRANADQATLEASDLGDYTLQANQKNGFNAIEMKLRQTNGFAYGGFNNIVRYRYRSNLHNVSLVGANLNGADFDDAWLINGDLQGATLVSAELDDTDLTGANLMSADLTDADLKDTLFCQTTMPDGVVSTNDCE